MCQVDVSEWIWMHSGTFLEFIISMKEKHVLYFYSLYLVAGGSRLQMKFLFKATGSSSLIARLILWSFVYCQECWATHKNTHQGARNTSHRYNCKEESKSIFFICIHKVLCNMVERFNQWTIFLCEIICIGWGAIVPEPH